MNIYAKLTILCIFLVTFTSGILFFITSRQVNGALQKEIQASALQQSRDKIHAIERFIFSRLNDVRMAAKNPVFQASGTTGAQLTEQLRSLENTSNLYHSFSFFNGNRVRLADSQGLMVGEVHPGDNYWEKLSGESDAVMDISLSQSANKLVMHFAAKVTRNNQLAGVLVGRILVDELYKIMGDFYLSNDSTRRLDVTLTEEDGTLLYSNDNTKEILVQKYDEFDLINTAIADNQSLLETDNTLYFITQETGYLNFSGNKWILILSIPIDVAYSPSSVIRKQLLYAILPVLIATIIFALIAANIFVRPIVRLSMAAEEIGKGNLTFEIPKGPKDEVGKLAKQLENASQTLIQRIEEQKKLNQKLEEQKTEIGQVNQTVVDSITYAERIQKNILPDISNIIRLVSDAFILYKPKDVVSGDFYWFEKVRQGRDEYLILVCADCTGHGVPGAIMSIMGSNMLTNIIYYQNYMDPRKILARMDKAIKFELRKGNDDSMNPDGMEIGICIINLEDLRMEFSGAGIPLHLVKHSNDPAKKELIIYKSPKYMIGGMEGDEREVEDKLISEIIQLEEGDKLYLSSDGYQDQFGGLDDKKFLAKNFRTLIEESASEPMDKQAQILEHRFQAWKKDTPQTDDVCIIGIEV